MEETMKNMIRYSQVVLGMVSKAVSETEPVIETERGSLYLLPKRSMGAIRLKIRLGAYLQFLESIEEDKRPKERWIVPVEDENFDLVVDTPVEIRDGKTFADEREIVLL